VGQLPGRVNVAGSDFSRRDDARDGRLRDFEDPGYLALASAGRDGSGDDFGAVPLGGLKRVPRPLDLPLCEAKLAGDGRGPLGHGEYDTLPYREKLSVAITDSPPRMG